MVNRFYGSGDFSRQFGYNSRILIGVCNSSGAEVSGVSVGIYDSLDVLLTTIYSNLTLAVDETTFLADGYTIKANEVLKVNSGGNAGVHTTVSVIEENLLTDGGGNIAMIAHSGDGVSTLFALPTANKPATDISQVEVVVDGLSATLSDFGLTVDKNSIEFGGAPFVGAEIEIRLTKPSGA